jgi:hypothetical protein
VGAKGHNKRKWGQGKTWPQNDKEKLASKELLIKKAKRDLFNVKCFNCDNNEHLAKDCPKPPWISECIVQGKLIVQGGFMAKIGHMKAKPPIS